MRRLCLLLVALGLCPSQASAEALREEQSVLLGVMARLACLAERDGHDHDWQWQRIKQFLVKDGSYDKELGKFTWQPAVAMTVKQLELAMKEFNCKSVDENSETWRRAIHMSDNLNQDGSPKPGFFDFGD